MYYLGLEQKLLELSIYIPEQLSIQIEGSKAVVPNLGGIPPRKLAISGGGGGMSNFQKQYNTCLG